MSRLRFYGHELRFMQCATIKPTIYLPKLTTVNTVIPVLMHLFTFSPLKVHFFASMANVFSHVKPDVSQSEATSHNFVGFATVYRRIYKIYRNFLTLSNQTSRYIRKSIRTYVHCSHIHLSLCL